MRTVAVVVMGVELGTVEADIVGDEFDVGLSNGLPKSAKVSVPDERLPAIEVKLMLVMPWWLPSL